MALHKETIEEVKSTENLQRIEDDTVRFRMYNGRVREAIKTAIAKEFKKPETIRELNARIIPINITQKIINTLAAVYQQAPRRSAVDKDINDQELIDMYVKTFRINQKMKFANRYFKLHKHTVIEPFIDHLGVPRMRTVASQMYTPIGEDPLQPERMTKLVKHVKFDPLDDKKSRFHIWTDSEFVIVDGRGEVVMEEMIELKNPDGKNPFGVILPTYISEADDGHIIPISDDDLVSMAIAIPLLLTDLSFASKYQLWSILAVIGADVENLTFNPNSIMALPPGAEVKVIKPELDSDKAMAMVEQLVGLLLTTKNLSVGDVTGTLSVGNLGAGVAITLDKAVTTEDRKDQQAFFEDGEKDFWKKFAHNILPVWMERGLVDPAFGGKFSDDFELAIQFADPKPFVGDRDRVELEKIKLDSGFTTMDNSLKVINPELDEDQIKKLAEDIIKDKKERIQLVQASFGEEESGMSGHLDEDEDDKEKKGS